MRKKFGQKGFTLVEMLISMSIFVTFVGILMNSYTTIVRSQREANEYRVMYSEARRVFESVIQEFREGMIDYGNNAYRCGVATFNAGIDHIYLISKDGLSKTEISFSDGVVSLSKQFADGNGAFSLPASVELNSDAVTVSDFQVYVYPAVDPYDQQYVYDKGYQFHPKVTIFASFEKEKNDGSFYNVDLQTSVSSRIYNQIYETSECPN